MRRWFLSPILPLACGALIGCGYDEYERDFAANTLPYFELRRELDATLATPWNGPGVSLRVPQGFDLVSPPSPPTEEELADEFYQPPRDPRQPEYLRDDLPGLKAAWRGPGGEKPGQRWIYLLDSSNLEDDPVAPDLAPEEFLYAVADRFARTLDLPTPSDDAYRRQTFPTPARPFAPQVAYSVPPEPLTGFIDGVDHRVELYAHESGGRITIVAVVLPTDDLLSDRSLGAARDLMLQTLETGRIARRAAPAGRGGGAGF